MTATFSTLLADARGRLRRPDATRRRPLQRVAPAVVDVLTATDPATLSTAGRGVALLATHLSAAAAWDAAIDLLADERAGTERALAAAEGDSARALIAARMELLGELVGIFQDHASAFAVE